MSNLVVNINKAESLETLQVRATEGYSVLRSAHVGNNRMYNLVLTACGIDILLVDHNVTGVDKGSVPGFIVSGGEASCIAPEGAVCMRTKLSSKTDAPLYLDDLHSDSLKQAFPNTRITLNTEYLRSEETVVGEIVATAIAEMPELFQRVIDRDSVSTRRNGYDAITAAKRVGIVQLQDNPRTDYGAMPPNEVEIVCNFVIEALRSKRSKQYHVAGSSMAKYVDGILPDIQKLYSLLGSSTSFHNDLPEKLEIELIPASNLRFAATNKNRIALDGLLAALYASRSAMESIGSERRVFFASDAARDDEHRLPFLADVTAREAKATQEIRSAAEQNPDVVASSHSKVFVSQYDVLEEGGLYVPDCIRTMTMLEIQALYSLLQKCMK